MNDEQMQGARASEYSPEELKAELARLDEKVTDNSLRIARHVVLAMTGSLETAEDLRQTALLKYFQLDENSRIQIRNPNAFLFKVMKNEVLNSYRKERPVTLESVAGEDLDRRFADTSHLDDELLLREIWSQVEGEDRRLFELLTFGYTGKELALRLGISQDASRQRVSRLIAKIKGILEENRVSS